MNVSIKVNLQSQKDWNPKMNSVIFVNNQEDYRFVINQISEFKM